MTHAGTACHLYINTTIKQLVFQMSPTNLKLASLATQEGFIFV